MNSKQQTCTIEMSISEAHEKCLKQPNQVWELPGGRRGLLESFDVKAGEEGASMTVTFRLL